MSLKVSGRSLKRDFELSDVLFVCSIDCAAGFSVKQDFRGKVLESRLQFRLILGP